MEGLCTITATLAGSPPPLDAATTGDGMEALALSGTTATSSAPIREHATVRVEDRRRARRRLGIDGETILPSQVVRLARRAKGRPPRYPPARSRSPIHPWRRLQASESTLQVQVNHYIGTQPAGWPLYPAPRASTVPSAVVRLVNLPRQVT
jgi:hypothetical protein